MPDTLWHKYRSETKRMRQTSISAGASLRGTLAVIPSSHSPAKLIRQLRPSETHRNVGQETSRDGSASRAGQELPDAARQDDTRSVQATCRALMTQSQLASNGRLERLSTATRSRVESDGAPYASAGAIVCRRLWPTPRPAIASLNPGTTRVVPSTNSYGSSRSRELSKTVPSSKLPT